MSRGAWLAALLCAVVHLPTLTAGFVYDDYPYVVDNVDLRGGPARIPGLFTSSFPSHAPERGLYRPLTATTYVLDRIGGPVSPVRHHATNLLLAALLVVASFAVLRRVLDPGPALAGTLLFAVHPVHVEAIAWVTGRSEILAALFACLSLALAIDFVRGRGGAARLVGAGFLLVLGLTSKENAAVALPLFALAVVLGGTDVDRRRAGPGIAAMTLALAIGLAVRQAALGAFGPQVGERVGSDGLLERLPLVVAALGEHLRLLAWPHPLSLERMLTAPDTFADPRVLAGAGVLAAWGVVAALERRRPGRRFLWAWPVVALLPVAHLVPIGETVAERFLLLPSVGFCGWLGAVALSAGRGRARVGIVAALLAAGAVLSFARATVWTNEESLWESALAHEPDSPTAWTALGDASRRRGDPDEAIYRYERALALDPSLTVTRQALAASHDAAGRPDVALEQSRIAVELDPTHPVALNNLGTRLARAGEMEEARALFRRAVEVAPGYAPALRNAALAELENGNAVEARELLARARAVDPLLPGLDTLEARLRAFPGDGAGQ